MSIYRRASEVAASEKAGATWRKSRRSGPSGTCVEAAPMSDRVAVRDSKHPDGPALACTPDRWDAFVVVLKQGHLGR